MPDRKTALAALAACILALSGCGGMNRAVGVLPNTLDDLGRKREAGSEMPAPAAGRAPAPGVSDPPPLPVQ